MWALWMCKLFFRNPSNIDETRGTVLVQLQAQGLAHGQLVFVERFGFVSKCGWIASRGYERIIGRQLSNGSY